VVNQKETLPFNNVFQPRSSAGRNLARPDETTLKRERQGDNLTLMYD
jgi:hypothetical protein